jgi:methyl-accepting chemotaxis protein
MKANLLNQSKEHALSIATMAAATVDGDLLESIQAGDEDTEAYSTVQSQLRSFLQGDEIQYVYTMRYVGNDLQFVVDADLEAPAAIGESYEGYDVIDAAFSGKASVDAEVTSDEWGRCYSGFAPIYNSANEIVGVVGVDCSVAAIDAENAATVRSVVLIEVISLLVSFVIAMTISTLLAKNVRAIDRKVE